MRKFFGREPAAIPERRTSTVVEESKSTVAQQQVESAKTLDYVQKVLDDKDRLLAEALNQTGNAVRRANLKRRAGDRK